MLSQADRDRLVLDNDRIARTLARKYRCHDDPEDLAQEARTGIIEAARRYDPARGDFAPYASRCAYGEVFHALRRRRDMRRSPMLLDPLPLLDSDESADPLQAAQFETVDACIDLAAVLRVAPRRERTVVVLCSILGFTQRQAGHRLGIGQRQAGRLLRKGLAHLRAVLSH